MMHGADQAMAKIAAALRGSTLDEVERLAGVIDFLTPEARFDLDDPRVATLQRAIRQQRVVRLRYHSFARDETTERDVEPHRLIYSDGTWYLSGNCRLRRESRSFRLSRIEELTTLTETFEVPSELAGEITAERVEVRVRVDARAARWVRERRVDRSWSALSPSSSNRWSRRTGCRCSTSHPFVSTTSARQIARPLGAVQFGAVQMMLRRCEWTGDDPLMIAYHDQEWGVPCHDDRALFERLMLEGFQAGLSWATILRKREHFRLAFDGWEPERVAAYGETEVARLLADPGIVRNRLKVLGAIRNARAFLEVRREHGTFDAYVWSFVGGAPLERSIPPADLAAIPPRTASSDALSKDLRRRGFTFVGSTICYAFMQSVGMVNDHTALCFRAAAAAPRREVG